jgi:type II secretory pathway predicted ATPase ExeA
METPDGFVQPDKGALTRSTVNYYLKTWGYDQERMTRQPPAVRFQAESSNECWHFDLSPSDLKHVKQPSWVEPGRGNPLLMLYSIVDDRSGLCYQEYHCVYGEDVEAALRFLFNAMTAKTTDGFAFQGIPEMIYTDNGPIAKSHVFQNVMDCLRINLVTHMPAGKDGRRVTARSKGKVERPFRTVKEAHETLYHFHEPESDIEANLWLRQYLLHYNDKPHRIEPHSRLEDWLRNIPKTGLRSMCSWERFCTFAREPQRRKVGTDARVSVEGVAYEVEPDLAGETVVLWWGLFDNELYVEKEGKILVSKSLSVDKNRATLPTLIAALFYDLSTDKEIKIPALGEKRERELRDLIRKGKKPVALFVDEAHDLHYSTLTGLKRLIEVVEDGGGTLSVVLAGHPKLKNDLRRPTMEEIGYRATVFSLEGIVGSQKEYIEWLVSKCTTEDTQISDIFEPDAIDLLAMRLRTPLQIEQHLTLAFEAAYLFGEKTVTTAIIESILSKQIDDLEPTLTRHGYDVRGLAEQFNAKPAEIKLLFRGQLDPARSRELHEQMLAAGLPL